MLWRQSKSPTSLRKDNRGVTLIEVIAVIAVLSIVMAAVTGFVISGAKMSAKVSSSAGDSIKEQTAVEYINRWILGAKSVKVVVDPDFGDGEQTYSSKLALDDGIIYHNQEEDIIVYQRAEGSNPIELCSGEIYFRFINDTTIEYQLNGEKHVVHLRSEKVISDQDT